MTCLRTRETRRWLFLAKQSTFAECDITVVFSGHAGQDTQIGEALQALGCTVENKRSGSGHKTVRYGNRKTDLPYHGGNKDIPDSLVNRIVRKLGLNLSDLDL